MFGRFRQRKLPRFCYFARPSYDKEGICNYLEVPNQNIPREGNGKTTLKQFFRKFGKVFHEGERAADIILGLDMDLIVASAEIQLHLVDERCFPPVSSEFS